MVNDVYQMLKKDHKNVKRLLSETLENNDPSEFPKIRRELEAHILGEENTFIQQSGKKKHF